MSPVAKEGDDRKCETRSRPVPDGSRRPPPRTTNPNPDPNRDPHLKGAANYPRELANSQHEGIRITCKSGRVGSRVGWVLGHDYFYGRRIDLWRQLELGLVG